ncbi:cytochrome P450 [Streptomyces sp. NPDC127068]|uniref:cytochrome P450 n=1 Tax=Streptomyces sp. NPDC127068 TaxID=3347127 RepID=UPI00364A40FA
MGEVVPAPWGGYFLTRYDVCSRVLRDRNWLTPDAAWQDRRGDPRWQAPATLEMSHTLPRLNAPVHTRQRRSLGNLFDRAEIERLTPQVERDVAGLLDRLEEDIRTDGSAEFVHTVADRLPVRTVGQWLGFPAVDDAHILELTQNQAHAQELLPTSSQLAMAAEATLHLRSYFADLVRERRARPGDDSVSRWIEVWDELEPDREEADRTLRRLTMFITLASLETTAALLSSMVWLLLREPGLWAWLRDHPEHIPDAVEETLRYDPPVNINTRVAGGDTVLAGVPVAKDTMVYVMHGAAHHDPLRNPDPRTFDVLRRGSHLAFGGGMHYCLGAALARLEARVLLTRLLERFPDLSLVTPPSFAPRMVFRRMTSLSVTA